ncbi:MAG TPA: DUF3857 domain-containing protein [Puia sp.]|nr:DUF3857 domain-containing protein [Puia sp.]
MHVSGHKIVILCLLTAVVHPARSQSDLAKYKERSAAIRQEVWGWNIPAFKQRTVPAEYAGESSVILAKRAVIEADSKKKMNWAMLGAQRNFYYNSTARELVKINDKVSLEEYSQLSYRQFKKLNGWISATSSTFVGARIIKPDGSVKEVSEDEAVLLKASKNDLQRKLAISDLQVGDILDYYVRVEELSEMFKEPERLIFVFGEDHPILDYSIHCDIGAKYAVEYRSMNKAPEARQSFNDDKDFILDLNVQHIAAVPTDLWMSSLRELPAFRINVLAGGKSYSGRSMGEVVKNVPLSDVLERIHFGGNPYFFAAMEKEIQVLMKNFDKHYSKLPDDSLAYLIYYCMRFDIYYNQKTDLEVGEERNGMSADNNEYLSYLQDILKKYRIRSTLVAAPSRYGPDISQVMNDKDLMVMLRVDLDKPFYFTNRNIFTYPGYIPSYLEGQPCPEVLQKKANRSNPVGLEVKAPLSNAAENVHQESVRASLDGDMQSLRVKRHTVLTGKMKDDEQIRLLNFEDYYESERQALHVEKSIMDELKKARRSKNISEDYATALQKARASLKDRFKDEIESEYDQQPKELLVWKVDNMGIRHNAPDLTYSTEFTLEGLVQRAGNNFLLNIGKLVNSPLKLTPSQRIRTVDVYMGYARTLDCTVAFDIPKGFTVQGADKLNKTVDNECGSVISTAQLQGNQLIIHFKRLYKHNMEPAGKWPMLLAIIDATTDFAGQKVLLKKG